MFLKRIIITALVVVAAAVLAPAAFAMLDAAPDPSVHQDLRSPDARLAPPVYQDLRLPGARDAGRDVVVPRTPPVSAPAGRAAEVSGAEFPWLQVGLAAVLALADRPWHRHDATPPPGHERVSRPAGAAPRHPRRRAGDFGPGPRSSV